MTRPENARRNEEDFELNLFCTLESGDAWRVRVWPGWLPKYLRHCFDENGEVYPVYLDLKELDRQMQNNQVECVKRRSALGGYELSAVGRGATVLAIWLSQSLVSGKLTKSVADEGSSAEPSGAAG
jgi:hypothetical protein